MPGRMPKNGQGDDRRNSRVASPGARWFGFQITLEGWVAVALTGWVLASAVISHASLTLLVFCLLVSALVVGATQSVRNLRRVEAVRRLPDQVVAGRPFHIEIEVHNRRLLGSAQGLYLESPIRRPVVEQQPGLFLHSVPPRGHMSDRIELVLPKRGRYELGEIELSSRFPFGFLERNLVIGERQELLVYPRLGKLSRRFFEFERESHPHQEGRRPGPATFQADFHGLREFRDGDSPRWIHWPTSARRGQIMVREFEARHNRDVLILLDPWLPVRPEARDHELLELAVSFAASLCVELCRRQGLHLVLGIASDPVVVRHGESSARLLREFLEVLAVVPGTTAPPWEELLRELPAAWTGRMRITAVSPRSLSVSDHLVRSGNGARRWQNLSRRLVEVNVARPDLRDFFQLEDNKGPQN